MLNIIKNISVTKDKLIFSSFSKSFNIKKLSAFYISLFSQQELKVPIAILTKHFL